MSILSPALRVALCAVAFALAGCASHTIVPGSSQSSAVQSLRPAVKYTAVFTNASADVIGWKRTDENCMKNNIPNVSDLQPKERVSYTVDTNNGCCRCSHESSWFYLRFYTPDGAYRDVDFEKFVTKPDWVITNHDAKGDDPPYFCERTGGPSILGVIIRGNKCPG